MMNRDFRLRVECAMPEKLLERALGAGARFRRIRRDGPRSMVFSTDAAGADILMALCRKYGLDLRILHRSGLSALRTWLHRRRTLAAGILLCLLMCSFCFTRIWRVDIYLSGPRAHLGDTAQIRSRLREHDFYPGMPARKLDVAALQKQLAAADGNYSFIGVRRQGMRLLVEASPEVPAPQLYRRDAPRDLVAACDGVVESVQVYAGEACVQPGDTVIAGQLLIRGRETTGTDPETGDEITAPVAALGEVIARCWCEGSAEAPLMQTIIRPTGRENAVRRLRLMDFSLPLAAAEEYACADVETHVQPLVGLFLPLEIEHSLHRETRVEQLPRDASGLAAEITPLAVADARRSLAAGFGEYEIAANWLDIQNDNDTLRVRAVYELYTDIAVTRDAWTEEVY